MANNLIGGVVDKRQYWELKMTVLKIASDMLTNEYVDRKAENHNQWVAQNELMWKTQRVRLPYPSFPPYPTQEQVLQKAKSLWKCFFLDEKVIESFPELVTATVANTESTTAGQAINSVVEAASTVGQTEAITTEVAEVAPDELTFLQTTELNIENHVDPYQLPESNTAVSLLPAISDASAAAETANTTTEVERELAVAEEAVAPLHPTKFSSSISNWLWLAKRTKDQ
jgi:hypothetical protein